MLPVDGLNRDQRIRLDELVWTIDSALEQHPLSMGIAGRPFEYMLPDGVASNGRMCDALVKRYSSDNAHVEASIVRRDDGDYLSVCRRVGL
ncbi:hypothetical protein HY640_02585 [Candidatus Woesearchaeota archaeon]|nr:hypothetical protein [Candidatus Woesearchaeota archaeon]